MYLLLCFAVFVAAVLVNTAMISVGYHRGLAHRAIRWSPRVERFVATYGIWFTGLDPKGWVCMHRMHHAFSDTPRDPHSPANLGKFGVLIGQLKSYERILVGLARGNTEYTRHVTDLEFPVNWLNRRRMWLAPYLFHIALSVVFAMFTDMWLLAAAYYFGIMSHPVEGWIVNAFGHSVGDRNWDTPDDSTNNLFAAWAILGEGLQNNHHRYPSSARFSYRPHEPDGGWRLVQLFEKLGWLTVDTGKLIPEWNEDGTGAPVTPKTTPSRTHRRAA